VPAYSVLQVLPSSVRINVLTVTASLIFIHIPCSAWSEYEGSAGMEYSPHQQLLSLAVDEDTHGQHAVIDDDVRDSGGRQHTTAAAYVFDTLDSRGAGLRRTTSPDSPPDDDDDDDDDVNNDDDDHAELATRNISFYRTDTQTQDDGSPKRLSKRTAIASSLFRSGRLDAALSTAAASAKDVVGSSLEKTQRSLALPPPSAHLYTPQHTAVVPPMQRNVSSQLLSSNASHRREVWCVGVDVGVVYCTLLRTCCIHR
jgi:hypothetical protein